MNKKNIIIKVLILAVLAITIFSIKDKFIVYGSGTGHTHKYSTWVKSEDATCTEAEKGYYKCSCGAKGNSTTKGDPLGHNPGDAATCTTAQTCTRCNYVYEKALGHKWGNDWTRNNDTNHIRYCQRGCGASEKENHKYGKWSNNGESGHIRYCSVCNDPDTAPHDIAYSVVNDALHYKYCTTCTYGKNEGHIFGWDSDHTGKYDVGKHWRTCEKCTWTGPHVPHTWKPGDGDHVCECNENVLTGYGADSDFHYFPGPDSSCKMYDYCNAVLRIESCPEAESLETIANYTIGHANCHPLSQLTITLNYPAYKNKNAELYKDATFDISMFQCGNWEYFSKSWDSLNGRDQSTGGHASNGRIQALKYETPGTNYPLDNKNKRYGQWKGYQAALTYTAGKVKGTLTAPNVVIVKGFSGHAMLDGNLTLDGNLMVTAGPVFGVRGNDKFYGNSGTTHYSTAYNVYYRDTRGRKIEVDNSKGIPIGAPADITHNTTDTSETSIFTETVKMFDSTRWRFVGSNSGTGSIDVNDLAEEESVTIRVKRNTSDAYIVFVFEKIPIVHVVYRDAWGNDVHSAAGVSADVPHYLNWNGNSYDPHVWGAIQNPAEPNIQGLENAKWRLRGVKTTQPPNSNAVQYDYTILSLPGEENWYQTAYLPNQKLDSPSGQMGLHPYQDGWVVFIVEAQPVLHIVYRNPQGQGFTFSGHSEDRTIYFGYGEYKPLYQDTDNIWKWNDNYIWAQDGSGSENGRLQPDIMKYNIGADYVGYRYLGEKNYQPANAYHPRSNADRGYGSLPGADWFSGSYTYPYLKAGTTNVFNDTARKNNITPRAYQQAWVVYIFETDPKVEIAYRDNVGSSIPGAPFDKEVIQRYENKYKYDGYTIDYSCAEGVEKLDSMGWRFSGHMWGASALPGLAKPAVAYEGAGEYKDISANKTQDITLKKTAKNGYSGFVSQNNYTVSNDKYPCTVGEQHINMIQYPAGSNVYIAYVFEPLIITVQHHNKDIWDSINTEGQDIIINQNTKFVVPEVSVETRSYYSTHHSDNSKFGKCNVPVNGKPEAGKDTNYIHYVNSINKRVFPEFQLSFSSISTLKYGTTTTILNDGESVRINGDVEKVLSSVEYSINPTGNQQETTKLPSTDDSNEAALKKIVKSLPIYFVIEGNDQQKGRRRDIYVQFIYSQDYVVDRHYYDNGNGSDTDPFYYYKNQRADSQIKSTDGVVLERAQLISSNTVHMNSLTLSKAREIYLADSRTTTVIPRTYNIHAGRTVDIYKLIQNHEREFKTAQEKEYIYDFGDKQYAISKIIGTDLGKKAGEESVSIRTFDINNQTDLNCAKEMYTVTNHDLVNAFNTYYKEKGNTRLSNHLEGDMVFDFYYKEVPDTFEIVTEYHKLVEEESANLAVYRDLVIPNPDGLMTPYIRFNGNEKFRQPEFVENMEKYVGGEFRYITVNYKDGHQERIDDGSRTYKVNYGSGIKEVIYWYGLDKTPELVVEHRKDSVTGTELFAKEIIKFNGKEPIVVSAKTDEEVKANALMGEEGRYSSYVLYRTLEDNSAEATGENRVVQVSNNGSSRRIVFIYVVGQDTTKGGVEIANSGSGDELEQDMTYVLYKANDGIFKHQENEEYDVVNGAVPTSEDMYTNVISDTFKVTNTVAKYSDTVSYTLTLLKDYYERDDYDDKTDAESTTGVISEAEKRDIKIKPVAYDYPTARESKLSLVDYAIVKNDTMEWHASQEEINGFNAELDRVSGDHGIEYANVNADTGYVEKMVGYRPVYETEPYFQFTPGGKIILPKEKLDVEVTQDATDYGTMIRGKFTLYSGDKLTFKITGRTGTDKKAADEEIQQIENIFKDHPELILKLLEKAGARVVTDNLDVVREDSTLATIWNGKSIPFRSEFDNYKLNDYAIMSTNPSGALNLKPRSLIQENLLYKNNDLYVSRKSANDTFETTGTVIYKEKYCIRLENKVWNGKVLIENGKTYIPEDKKDVPGNNVNVHTPVVDDSHIVRDAIINQKAVVVPETDEFCYLQLDGSFNVNIPWTTRNDQFTYRGYKTGRKNTGVYGEANVRNGKYGEEQPTRNGRYNSYQGYQDEEANAGNTYATWGAIKDVRVPFDTYLDIGSNNKLFIEGGRWLSEVLLDKLGKLETIKFFMASEDTNKQQTSYRYTIPVWVDEMMYKIDTRVIAENAIEYLDLMGKAQGSDKYKDLFTKNKLNGMEFKNDTISEVADRASKKQLVANYDKENYVAYKEHWVEVIGIIYDLQVSGTEDPDWKIAGTGGDKATGGKIGAAKFPFGSNMRSSIMNDLGTPNQQNANQSYPYAPKLGYAFQFSFKVKGRKSNNIKINVEPQEFFFVGKDGKTETVDLYYKKNSNSTYVRIGSEEADSILKVAPSTINAQYISREMGDSNVTYPKELVNPVGRNPATGTMFAVLNYSLKYDEGRFDVLNLTHPFRMVYNSIISEYATKLYGANKGNDAIGVDAASTNKTASKNANESGLERVGGSVGHWYASYTLPISTIAIAKKTTSADGATTSYSVEEANEIIRRNDQRVIRKDGYIVVNFGIMTVHENADENTVTDYLVYTGPNTRYDAGDKLDKEEVDIDWKFVAPSVVGDKATGGKLGGFSIGVAANKSSTRTNIATNYVVTTNGAETRETTGDKEALQLVDINKAGDTMKAAEANPNTTLPKNTTVTYKVLEPDEVEITDSDGNKVQVKDSTGKYIYSTLYANPNVINEKEHNLYLKHIIEGGEAYNEIIMPNGVKAVGLPAGATSIYEGALTAKQDTSSTISY